MEINFDVKRIKTIDIRAIHPNSWNPKEEETEEYNMVRKSIKVNGLKKPIVVRENNDYEIIDGEQRWRACKELGYKKVVIYNEGKVSDKKAKELTLWYQTQVPFDEIELGVVLKEMIEEYENVSLPYSDLDIEDLTGLINFELDDYEEERPEFDEEPRTIKIIVTESQYKIIMDTIEQIKESENLDSDGRALELICADYLAGI